VNFDFSGNADYTLVVANTVPSGVKLDPNAIGATMVKDGVVLDRGAVYESRLEQFDPAASRNTAFLATGLGRAGAHEVGHSLLQLNKHTSAGLMQAAFSGSAWHLPDQNGNFSFTPPQATALQNECNKRHNAARGGGNAINPNSDYWLDLLGDYIDWLLSAGGGGDGETPCPACVSDPPHLVER
jgi:hypothetical protein